MPIHGKKRSHPRKYFLFFLFLTLQTLLRIWLFHKSFQLNLRWIAKVWVFKSVSLVYLAMPFFITCNVIRCIAIERSVKIFQVCFSCWLIFRFLGIIFLPQNEVMVAISFLVYFVQEFCFFFQISSYNSTFPQGFGKYFFLNFLILQTLLHIWLFRKSFQLHLRWNAKVWVFSLFLYFGRSVKYASLVCSHWA